jgi:ABC-type antimicrobial peptide transport system permease subunit
MQFARDALSWVGPHLSCLQEAYNWLSMNDTNMYVEWVQVALHTDYHIKNITGAWIMQEFRCCFHSARLKR